MFRLTPLIIAVLTLGLNSCASRPVTSPPLPQFQHIELIVSDATAADLPAYSTAQLMSIGAASGATGAAVYGLGCGPFAVFCVPLFAAVGGIGGVLGGALGGALVETGNRKDPTGEQRRQIAGVPESLGSYLELNKMLRQSLGDVLPDFVEIVQSDTEAMVQVRVTLLELRQHGKERSSLNIIAEMKTFWGFEDRKPTIQTNQYQCETPPMATEDLSVNDGKQFTRGIPQCVEHIAGLMARDLGHPGKSQFD